MILDKIFGNPNDKEIKKLMKTVREINELEPSMQKLSNEELQGKTDEFKERLKKSAKSNQINEFKFTYDDCIQDALVEGYDQNADFYTLLLNNEEVRAQFANVFMGEIYKILRDEKDD